MNSLLTLATATLFAVAASTVLAEDPKPTPPAEKAVAILAPTKGSEVKGTITFTKVAEGIRVEGEVTGLTPGKHGFHIHEFGDPSSPDGTSAGGHFNPGGQPHSGPHSEHRHAGDFGNIEAGSDGTAKIDMLDKLISFEGKDTILGRGVVVHAKADDLKSQPSGDAGDRVAVGVIGVTKAK